LLLKLKNYAYSTIHIIYIILIAYIINIIFNTKLDCGTPLGREKNASLSVSNFFFFVIDVQIKNAYD